MSRIAVRLRVDGHGANAHPVSRLDNPAGDLAAVGNQDLLKGEW
jgi:hypothetical protein